MTGPIPLPSELNQPKSERILSVRPKKPVAAVCQSVKQAVTNELNYHVVKKIDEYRRVGEIVVEKTSYSFQEKGLNSASTGENTKAHIQEKKAKNVIYKKGKDEITLDELFVIQNGENHG